MFYDSQELRALQLTGLIGGAGLKTQNKPGNEFCLLKALNSKEDRFEKIVALTSHIGGHLHTGTHIHNTKNIENVQIARGRCDFSPRT